MEAPYTHLAGSKVYLLPVLDSPGQRAAELDHDDADDDALVPGERLDGGLHLEEDVDGVEVLQQRLHVSVAQHQVSDPGH